MGLLAPPTWRTPRTPPGPAYTRLPHSPTPSNNDDASDITVSSARSSRDIEDRSKGQDDDEFQLGETDPLNPSNERSGHRRRRDPVIISLVALALGAGLALFLAFPFPTTIHVFIPAALALTTWVVISWLRLGYDAARAYARSGTKALCLPRSSVPFVVALVASSVLVMYWACLGVVPPPQIVPSLPADKYFIAADLYNNEAILPQWQDEMVKLIKHLGPENTFLSIYESNSKDSTPAMLASFADRLSEIGAPHRVVSDTTERWWAYGSSPERIGFLADARNHALAPLQSGNETVRLPDYSSYTKILFLNDIVWNWEAAVRLLATEFNGDGYDLACGMDMFSSGIYDTWVARDVCGTPFRVFWPHVKDPISAARLREDQVFQVTSCWNGMVAYPTGPYLYRPESSPVKRGWEMIDNATFPHAKASPPLTQPIKFRPSGIDSCDHSECFLYSYDIHRLYTEPSRPPRILMNPNVLVAYDKTWWGWNNIVLRIPVVKWWRYYWSHGIPMLIIDKLVEYYMRRRDFCTWAAMAPHLPLRCPPLPGPAERQWDMAG